MQKVKKYLFKCQTNPLRNWSLRMTLLVLRSQGPKETQFLGGSGNISSLQGGHPEAWGSAFEHSGSLREVFFRLRSGRLPGAHGGRLTAPHSSGLHVQPSPAPLRATRAQVLLTFCASENNTVTKHTPTCPGWIQSNLDKWKVLPPALKTALFLNTQVFTSTLPSN